MSAENSDAEEVDDAGPALGSADLSKDARQALIRAAFSRLKPVCAPLLLLRQDRAGLTSCLLQLRAALKSLDSPALQGCMDYVLYPLLLIIQSIPAARDANGSSGPAVPVAASDSVAEGALQCVAILLKKCYPDSPEVVLELLQSLAPVLELPRDSTSEEVRASALQAIQYLLVQLPSQPPPVARTLSQEENSMFLAFLSSLFLRAAEEEAAAGASGSKGLRVGALRALRLLFAAVDNGDALAFILPGVVSRLARALLLAGAANGKHKQTGAVASSTATLQALQALIAIVLTTLGDSTLPPGCLDHVTGNSKASQPPTTAKEALSALALMAKASAVGSSAELQAPPSGGGATILEREASARKSRAGVPAELRKYKEERNAEWVQNTSEKVCGLLWPALSPLLAHPSPAVRTAVARGITAVLDECGCTLRALSENLLEAVFTLAQDDWPQVATPCREWLSRRSALPQQASRGSLPSASPGSRNSTTGATTAPGGSDDVVLGIASRLVLGLEAALQRGEHEGTLHARRLCTALQVLQPETVATKLLNAPAQLDMVCGALCRSLAFDRSAAGLLVYAPPEGGAYVVLHPAVQPSAPLIQPQLPQFEAAQRGAGLGSEARPSAPAVAEAQPPIQNGSQIEREFVEISSLDSGPAAAGAAAAVSPASGDATKKQLLEHEKLGGLGSKDRGIEPGTSGASAVQTGNGNQRSRERNGVVEVRGVSFCSDGEKRRRVDVGGDVRETVDGYGNGKGGEVEAGGEAGDRGATVSGEVSHSSPGTAQVQGISKVRAFDTGATAALPRMPQGLALVASAAAYEAVADVARTVGRLASLAGGNTLRRVVDELLRRLERRTQAMNGLTGDASWPALPLAASGRGRAASGASPGWQLEAASVVTVLAEVLYGSSSSWPAAALLPRDGPAAAGCPKEARDRELESLVALVQDELVQEKLWGVRTATQAAEDADGALPLPPQVVGENIVLARALLEAVGVFATSVGARYAASGVLLRVALLPVLERLGDPAAAVASSAAAAFGCMCRSSGYRGLPDLVAANADYVVDSLCAQLRELDSHPRAPALFAVLLGAAGLGPQLLPLLAEPARAAVKGLSITSRRKHPSHSAAFLAALREICIGVREDAQHVAGELRAYADDVAAKIASMQAERARREERASQNAASSREYFKERLERHRRRLERKAERAGSTASDSDEDDEAPRKVTWTEGQWAAVGVLRARCHSDAVLASAAADVAGPLLYSRNTRAALLALEVGREGLHALTATQGFVDTWDRQLQPYLSKRNVIEPNLPQIPAMLPHVHALWAPLLGALKDSRPPVVERAVGLLASVTVIGGGAFMANRVSREAWPQLARLMADGPAVPSAPHAPPRDSGLSPAVLQRTRHAALACIARIAGDERSCKALASVLEDVARAVVLYIGDHQSPAVRQVSGQAVLALAGVDTDVVWCVLTEAASWERRDILEQPRNPDPSLFPPYAKISPSPSGRVARVVPGVAERARALLKQVEGLHTRWHDEVAAQLERSREARARASDL